MKVDLTKILKVGDPVWSILHQKEGVVHDIDEYEEPIGVRFPGTASTFWHDKFGSYESSGLRTLYPVDQRPEIQKPDWPELYEWQGEAYKIGEWVAVSDDGNAWRLLKFHGISSEGRAFTIGHRGRIYSWRKMRKLSSFNTETKTPKWWQTIAK